MSLATGGVYLRGPGGLEWVLIGCAGEIGWTNAEMVKS
jgi:hypothetical protein